MMMLSGKKRKFDEISDTVSNSSSEEGEEIIDEKTIMPMEEEECDICDKCDKIIRKYEFVQICSTCCGKICDDCYKYGGTSLQEDKSEYLLMEAISEFLGDIHNFGHPENCFDCFLDTNDHFPGFLKSLYTKNTRNWYDAQKKINE